MFSPELKREISEKIQAILQATGDPELPKGEIQFILHVDGEEIWSWANIRNNERASASIPVELVGNMSNERN